MRRLFLAAIGALAVAGAASAQQPVPQQPVYPQSAYQQPVAPVQYPSVSPGAVAATPVAPAAGTTVIQGSGGCANCPTGKSHTFTMQNVTGGNCYLGYRCQNGCGSVRSDFAFQFGTCSQFFNPCGPTVGGLWHKCGVTPFAGPFGTGWQCPRQYDTYANH